MKNKVQIFIIGIILATILIVFVQDDISVSTSDDQNVRQIILTNITLKRLSILISVMLEEGYENPLDMGMIIEYSKIIQDIPIINKIDENKICDEWGNPIILVVEDCSKYTLISFGTNQQDDHGKGDDLVETYGFGCK